MRKKRRQLYKKVSRNSEKKQGKGEKKKSAGPTFGGKKIGRTIRLNREKQNMWKNKPLSEGLRGGDEDRGKKNQKGTNPKLRYM